MAAVLHSTGASNVNRQEVRLRILNWSYVYADKRPRRCKSSFLIVMKALERDRVGALSKSSDDGVKTMKVDKDDADYIDAQLLKLPNHYRRVIVEEYRRPLEYSDEHKYFSSLKAKANKLDMFPKTYLARLDEAETVFARQLEAIENRPFSPIDYSR